MNDLQIVENAEKELGKEIVCFQYERGHLIGEIEDIGYIYLDTFEPVDYDRSCPKCNEYPTIEGHDSCLGILDNVKFACCGHGTTKAYITFNDGKTIRGKKATKWIERNK